MAAKAKVKKLVLTHYPPFEVKVPETLAIIKEFYSGEVVFGQDAGDYRLIGKDV